MSKREANLPTAWREEKLGAVAEVRLGKMLSSKAREPGLLQLPYLRNENVRWGHIDFTDVKTMGFKPTEMDRYRVAPGDLLVCEGGEPGRAAVYAGPPGKFMYQKALHRVRVRSETVSSNFLRYFFEHQAALLTTSQTTIAHFPLERMLELRVPLPMRDEQDSIVAEIEKQFTRLDAGVEALRRLQAHLRRYRAAVLKAAFDGRLVTATARAAHNAATELALALGCTPKARPTPAPLPVGWCWAAASDLFSFVTSGSRGWAKYYSESGPAFLRIGNLDRLTTRLDLADLQRVSPPPTGEGVRTRLAARDVLVSITADLGLVAVVPETLGEAYVNQHLALARPISGVDAQYLGWFIASPQGQQQLQLLRRGATKAGLGLDDIRAVWVPLPPLENQRAIVAEIEAKFSSADSADLAVHNATMRALRLRTAILKSAFEGRLVYSQEPARANVA